MLHFFVPDNVSSKRSILLSTSIVNLPIMYSSGRHTDPSSTASNFRHAISVDNSSIKEYEISCPKQQIMLISSVLFVSNLMCYGNSILLGVLTHPLVIAQTRSWLNDSFKRSDLFMLDLIPPLSNTV